MPVYSVSRESGCVRGRGSLPNKLILRKTPSKENVPNLSAKGAIFATAKGGPLSNVRRLESSLSKLKGSRRGA